MALAPDLDALLRAREEEHHQARELLDVDHVCVLAVLRHQLHGLGVARAQRAGPVAVFEEQVDAAVERSHPTDKRLSV